MKRGLVVEGGGMRGAHSCGALMALADRGLTDFDVVAATSAGACTSAFLVSRQFDMFPVIWTKYLHDGRFINLMKLATRQSVMDLDYLIHEVFRNLEPLDVDSLRRNPTCFYVSATDCLTGTASYFNNHEDFILNALKASSAMPIAYRHPVIIDNRPYVDGGIVDSIPIQKALDEGCGEIFVLLTRPEGYRKKAPLVNLLPRIYQKKYPRLAEAILRRHEVYNETLSRIENEDYPAKLTVIRPRQKLPVKRLTTNVEKIRAAIDQGYSDAMATLAENRLVNSLT